MLNEKIFSYIKVYSKRKDVNIKKAWDRNVINKNLEVINKNRVYKLINNIDIEKISLRKKLILFYYTFIINLFCSILLIQCKQRKIYSHDSSIHLKVQAPPGANIRILSEEFYNTFPPNEIRINGVIKDIQNAYSPNEFQNLDNNDVTITWNNEITSTDKMFEECSNILEIDFEFFESSKIAVMNEMFKGCSSLISINFNDFNTSNVNLMSSLFASCTALISLDLSGFDTSDVVDMNFMFLGCTSLVSLDLSNFNTSQVTSMQQLFSGCSNLISLDLSNFNLSKTSNMNSMFQQCSSLSYIFLSNFDTSKIQDLDNFFNGLSSLQFIILKESNILNPFVERISRINLENITICSDTYDYFENYFSESQKMICDKMSEEEIEKEFKCFMNHSLEYNKYSCEICEKDNDFLQLYNNEDFNNSYIKCSHSDEGYYLDSASSFYKPCYFSCKTCDINGNDNHHNCLECKDGYLSENFGLDYINCYNPSFTKSSNIIDNSYYSENLISDLKLSNTIINDTIYVSDFYSEFNKNEISTSYYKNSYKSYFYHSYNIISNIIIEESTQNIIIEDKEESIQRIIDKLLEESNLKDVDNGIDKIDSKDNLIFIFTSTENQKKVEKEKNITMDLGQCEIELKKDYNISSNDSL